MRPREIIPYLYIGAEDLSNKLLQLDFSPGIKAENINFNFELVEKWLKRERLRTAGYGLVEGFRLSADLESYIVTVGEGIMINEAGEEVIVPPTNFHAGAPESIDASEELVPDQEGNLRLKFMPYSPSAHGQIFYNPPVDKVYPQQDELYITDILSGSRVPILAVVGDLITVNAANWAGRKLKVDYKYTKDRMDSIMLHKNGSYRYEKSVISTSPSHVDLADYPDYRAVGLVHWQVGRTVTVSFYDGYRTYRKVYVDEQNRLYLNGKLYKDSQMIYFEEPPFPAVNDLWYDEKSNALMIWREKDGEYGWYAINNMSTIPLRELKMWTPETFPADAQTFLFSDEEINLRFVPGMQSLEVVIDQGVVMRDQYDEIVIASDKPYLSTGIGFKLKEPLDKACHVQVTVHHSVRTAPLRETFQRAAIFVQENFEPYNALNTERLFTTGAPYCIGEQQLEVYLQGRRLQRGTEFIEMLDGNTPAGAADSGTMSELFKLVCPVASGEIVAYKVTKHVWSYDHLDKMVNEIEGKADDALKRCAGLENALTVLNNNVSDLFKAMEEQIADLKKKLAAYDACLKKTDRLELSNMPQRVLDGAMRETFTSLMPASGDGVTVQGVKTADFIAVAYISPWLSRVLIRETEYTLAPIEGGMRIDLHPDYIASDANICVYGIKFGILEEIV